MRWVVIDTETSGLDSSRDALLAIGAVAIDADGVRPADSFERVIRHDGDVDRLNAAVHGIGRETQRGGVPVREAMTAFVAWAEDAPRIAFHADFDRRFLERAAKAANVHWPRAGWLDVAPLAAALARDAGERALRSLDEWLTALRIPCTDRHNAACDALATAELLLSLRARAAREGEASFDRLVRLSRQARWLGGG
jgi:DNA polymerase III subunit epsilon